MARFSACRFTLEYFHSETLEGFHRFRRNEVSLTPALSRTMLFLSIKVDQDAIVHLLLPAPHFPQLPRRASGTCSSRSQFLVIESDRCIES